MKTTAATCITLAALLAAFPAMAQQKPAPAAAQATPAKPAAKAEAAKPADNKALIGQTVENKKGKKLGSVVDAAPASGKLASINVKMDARTVKLTAKQFTQKDGKIIVKLSKKNLKKLPMVKG